MQFETEKAGALTLRAVNQQALLDTIQEMGDIQEIMAGNISADVATVLPASNRILTYVFGWGVVNAPPAAALETLAALGKPTHLPEIARANWLRYLVLSNEEASALLAAVITLAFAG